MPTSGISNLRINCLSRRQTGNANFSNFLDGVLKSMVSVFSSFVEFAVTCLFKIIQCCDPKLV